MTDPNEGPLASFEDPRRRSAFLARVLTLPVAVLGFLLVLTIGLAPYGLVMVLLAGWVQVEAARHARGSDAPTLLGPAMTVFTAVASAVATGVAALAFDDFDTVGEFVAALVLLLWLGACWRNVSDIRRSND